MTPTIRDVAKRLHLSITTVSRALDGYDDVAEKTRERVRRVAAQMGYTPSRAARQLRRRRADAIGYIMSTDRPRFSDPFFSEFVSGLGDEAASNGLELLLSVAPAGTEEEGRAYRRWIQSRRVDGIVLARTRLRDKRVRLLVDAQFPFAAFGRPAPAGPRQALKFPYVDVDHEHGMRDLVTHLVESGHRRIAHLGAESDFTFVHQRLAGYKSAIAEAGMAADDTLIRTGNLTWAGGFQAAERLLDLGQPPTALVAANDLLALGAMAAAQQRGLVIGQDLAVAGFDDVGEAENANPPLTTVRQPVYDIARQVARLLIERIERPTTPARHVLVTPELIVRSSTAHRRAARQR
jgi:LacI family transcriptional regulator